MNDHAAMKIPGPPGLPLEFPEPPDLSDAPDYYRRRALYEDERDRQRIRAEAEDRAAYRQALAQQAVLIEQLGEMVHGVAERLGQLAERLDTLADELAHEGDEIELLRKRVEAMEHDLSALKARLANLESRGGAAGA
jgi:chromosome segregation ATPase